jgi:hypothetical protein
VTERAGTNLGADRGQPPKGRIRILSPWRLVDYWSWTRRPQLRDFVLTR